MNFNIPELGPVAVLQFHYEARQGHVYDAAHSSILLQLPPHPDEQHRLADSTRPAVMTTKAAAQVCIRVQPDAFTSAPIQAAVVKCDGDVLVRVVWAKMNAMDALLQLQQEGLRRRWIAAKKGFQACTSGQHISGGGNTQVASGMYGEFGFGVMPGKGRSSISIDGSSNKGDVFHSQKESMRQKRWSPICAAYARLLRS